MDDEITKAFIAFMDSELSDKTVFHAAGLATMYPKNYENAKREAYGFVEGWNAALQWASNNNFNLTTASGIGIGIDKDNLTGSGPLQVK